MTRLITALLLAPFITWAVLWAPVYVFGAVLAVIAGLCYWEFRAIVKGHGIEIPGAAAVVLGTALLFANPNMSVAVLLAMTALIIGLRVEDLRDALPRSSAFFLAMLYIYGCWHMAVRLRNLNPNWLFFALGINWIGDTAAMYMGRAFGRHKMAPRVSPAKSWEGAAASVAASILAGVVFAQFALKAEPVWKVALIAAAGNVAGQIGDLCESAFKRGASMKDSGTLLPGHGGWLDRVDSSLFSVPVIFALLEWL